jgi:hypothetical protein
MKSEHRRMCKEGMARRLASSISYGIGSATRDAGIVRGERKI